MSIKAYIGLKGGTKSKQQNYHKIILNRIKACNMRLDFFVELKYQSSTYFYPFIKYSVRNLRTYFVTSSIGPQSSDRSTTVMRRHSCLIKALPLALDRLRSCEFYF